MAFAEDLNSRVGWFIVALAAVAALLLVPIGWLGTMHASQRELVYALFLCGGLIVTQHFAIHITEKTKVYVDASLLTAAVLLLPPTLAVASALIAAIAFELNARISWEQSLFNPAQTVIYVSAGSWIVYALTEPGPPRDFDLMRWTVAVLLSIAVMHLINTGAVAGAAALQLGKQPLQFWRQGFWIDLPEHLLLVVNGLVLAIAAASFAWVLPLLAGPLVLIYLSMRQRVDMRRTTETMIETLADLGDLLNRDSAGHSRRVAERTRQLALHLGVEPTDAEIAVKAARLHSVASVGGDPASADRNVGAGADHMARLVAMLPSHGAVADALRHQQERWDGLGSPDGLRGEQIPLTARIFAVADAFERFTVTGDMSRRSAEVCAAERVNAGSGTEWDPRIVAALTTVVEEDFAIAS